MADVHLISMRPEMTGIVVPGKLYGVMAAGRPAVFVGPRALRDGRHDPHGRLRDDRRREATSRDWLTALTRLAADPSLARRMGERGRSAFLAAYEQKLCCDHWSDLLARADPCAARAAAVIRRSRRPVHAVRHGRASIAALRDSSHSGHPRGGSRVVHASIALSPSRTANGESPHSLHRPAAGGIWRLSPRRQPGARSRPRRASPRSRPGTTAPSSASWRNTSAVHPRADDRDQAYAALFNKAIEHDWFAEVEDARPAIPQVRPRRAGQGAGADRPDDGAGPGRPLRRGAGAVPRADPGTRPQRAGGVRLDLLRLVRRARRSPRGNTAVARQAYAALLDPVRREPEPAPEGPGRPEAAGPDRQDGAGLHGGGHPGAADPQRCATAASTSSWISGRPGAGRASPSCPGSRRRIGPITTRASRSSASAWTSRRRPWSTSSRRGRSPGRRSTTAARRRDLVQAFGVSSIPATYLIDPEGTIIRLDLRGKALDETLARLIKRPAGARDRCSATASRAIRPA